MATHREQDGPPSGGENDWLAWVASFVADTDPQVRIGPGDDAAVLKHDAARGDVVVATDTLVEGVHFTADAAPASIGWKAVAVNLSDIAAMGCFPTAVVMTIAAPTGTTRSALESLMQGARDAAAPHRVAIVGGDFSRSPAGLHVTVTALGETRDLEPVRRCGARPGDVLLVTGPLGGSILGRHLSFEPRVDHGLRLNRAHGAHAMIDISDGLSIDLCRMMTASNTGARLIVDQIPVAAAAEQLAAESGRTALEHALDDGEDFELLVALDEASAGRALADPALKGLTAIGTVTQAGLRLIGTDGKARRMEVAGYEHRLDPDR